MASDPLDRNELPFVHEVDQKVMPTLAAVLSRGLGVTVAQLGFDYRYSVHCEQAILWHRPIPPQGEITGEGRVDRKSTVGTQVTNAHLVCRLLLEKKINV